ncbi:CapA family protein [Tissierella praeacuta]|uniref:CapA family protein n=1 Tax=Tissierella praeacuta TaxID=43131 RepID=UPI0033424693
MNKNLYLFFVLTIFSNVLPVKNDEIPSSQVNMVEQIEVEEKTTISLVGDILMDGSVRVHINKNGIEYPWEMVKNYFQEDDITIGNLETSITTKGTKWANKKFNFRSDPKNLKAMKEAGIDIVSVANNHSLDYGHDGFLDTLNYLDKYEIKMVGGGKNKQEAMEGIIVEKNGVKVGVLSFSRVVPDVKWYATDKRSGIVGAYDVHIKGIVDRIKEMKEEVDVLVLSIHWGVERSNIPRKSEIDLARKLVDAGADIVMGHHPHVLQGIEIYNGKPIFYSLGNFVFGSKNGLTSNTIIGQINLIGKDIESIQIIPCRIIMGRPMPVQSNEIKENIKYMNTISKDFKTIINEDGIIKIK